MQGAGSTSPPSAGLPDPRLGSPNSPPPSPGSSPAPSSGLSGRVHKSNTGIHLCTCAPSNTQTGGPKVTCKGGEASREQKHLAGTTQSSTCQGPVERPRQIPGLSRGAGAAVGTLVLRPRTDPRVRGGHDRDRTGQELILTKNTQCAGCLLEAWPPMPAPPPPGLSLTPESLTSAGGGRSVDARWTEDGREACAGIHTRQQRERLCFSQLRQLPRALCLFLPLILFYRLLKQVIAAGSPRTQGPRRAWTSFWADPVHRLGSILLRATWVSSSMPSGAYRSLCPGGRGGEASFAHKTQRTHGL